MDFSLEQLQAFVAVYEQLSFSKAAVKLNKHRTTIGQVIGNLEDQLAVELFERTGRSVKPTYDGDFLYHYAKQALEQAHVFSKAALSLSYGGLDNITIAYPSILPHRLLSDIRLQLDKDFPMMRVNFLVRNRDDIKRGVMDGSYHFGMVNNHESSAINSFDVTFLGNMEFVPFVQKGSKISALPSQEIFATLRNTRQFVLQSFIEEGLSDKVVLSANHEVVEQLALIIKLIQEGAGWALLPKVLSDSEYLTDNLQQVFPDEFKRGMKFGIVLCCQHSKQIAMVKKSIISAIDGYVERFHIIQNH